jgi:hypothetical protein
MTEILHTYVYGLHDGDFQFWYVGMTKDPEHRLAKHRNRNPRFTPDTVMHIFEEVTGTLDEVQPVEQLWIDGLRAIGYPLVNKRNIPYVPFTGHTTRTRRKLSEVMKASEASREHRKRLADARRGKPSGQPAPNKGVPMPESQRAKLRGPHKNIRIRLAPLAVSEETKRKLREANLRRGPVSEETKRKLKESGLRRRHSEETKAKMRGPRGPHKNKRVRPPLPPRPQPQPPPPPRTQQPKPDWPVSDASQDAYDRRVVAMVGARERRESRKAAKAKSEARRVRLGRTSF